MKTTVKKICLWAGAGLLVAALVMLLWWQLDIRNSRKQAQDYVKTIESLIPTPQGAVPEERWDNTMAVLSIEGTDFIGILEMPRFESVLPVAADWGKQYPCRFDGSIYDGSLQIGATTQKGQFDFYREICVGDRVYFTDMEGNRYTYEVTDLRYEEHADQEALTREESALTLFIKNEYAFEYIVLFCNSLH